MSSGEVAVSRSALATLRWSKDLTDQQVKAIALLAPFQQQPDLLSEIASLLLERRRKLVALLDTNDVERLLARMRDIKDFHLP